jgi:hypothetical protein
VVVHSLPNALSTVGKRTLAVLGPPLFARLQPMGPAPAGAISSCRTRLIEGAMIGRAGAVGNSAALEGKVSLSRAIVQLPGNMESSC